MKQFTVVTDAEKLADVIAKEQTKGNCVVYVFAEQHSALRVVTFLQK